KEKDSAEVNLFWVRYSIAEWQKKVKEDDLYRCPFTSMRHAFSLCATNEEIESLLKAANSLSSSEKKNLLTTGKDKYLRRLKNKFNKMKGKVYTTILYIAPDFANHIVAIIAENEQLVPFIVDEQNIQQIFATIIDYEDFDDLVHEDPTNSLLSGIMDFANPPKLLIKIFHLKLLNTLSNTKEFVFENKTRKYLESLLNGNEMEKPIDNSISSHDMETCIRTIEFLHHIWKQNKYNDQHLNFNESTYTVDMFTSIIKNFCMEDIDFITFCGEFETACSRNRRQALHEGLNDEDIDATSLQPEANFSADDVTIDTSKRGHKIDGAVGMRIMGQNLIAFLVVESKKPGVDSGNDKKKQLQEQCDEMNEIFCFYEDNYKKSLTKELLEQIHNLYIIGARISGILDKLNGDDQLEITVYDIPGSLLGRRRLLRRNIYVPSRVQLKHHTVDYIESLMAIKMLLKDLKFRLQSVEETLNKLINEDGSYDLKFEVDGVI
ncbi:13736_t:CDS:10, partial [Cetraspora pellucida]